MDEHHTHEVHAGVRQGPMPAFVAKESAYQNDVADEFLVEEHAIERPWETQLHHWQLECRLAALGRYWRHDATAPGWRPLVRPQGAPTLDLREVAVSPYRGRATFYHFHHAADRVDKLLLAIPNATPRGKRHLLAMATFTFPNVADGDVRLLHAHLPDAPARSLIAREHETLRERDFTKLVWRQDFQQAHGADWSREAGAAYAELLRRVSESRFGSPVDARHDNLDPVYTDFVRALTDPRLLELQAHYLTAEEQDAALALGDGAIRRLIAKKRMSARTSDDQHKLTLVEASLLARDQLRPGARVDPEVSALVRRFAYYL